MSAQIVSGIYRIRNTLNGRVYVGATVNLAERWRLHRLHLNRGTHHCQPLQRAWGKDGETAFVFEIIEPFECKKARGSREQLCLDEAFEIGWAYNIARKARSRFTKKRGPYNLRLSVSERFHAKIEPVTESGCWIWTASTTSFGYGKLSINRKQGPCHAHRVAWELYHGDIPHGLSVLHRCDVRLCVNPDHLYLGTQEDNMRDATQRDRMRGPDKPVRGMRSPNAKLTDAAARHIMRKEMSLRKYAQLYGVSTTAIRYVLIGRSWRSVTIEG